MVFGDGRKASGKVLGVHRNFDLTLLKLEGEGPWTAVPLGSTSGLKPGDPCLMVGHPIPLYRQGRPPLLRLGRVLGFSGYRVLTSCQTTGGDSGAPLLNLQGEMMGTSGRTYYPQIERGDLTQRIFGHVSVDVYGMLRSQLLEERVFSEDTLTGPFQNPEGLAGLATPVHRSVVTVLAKDKPVALGLVVADDGWIVTKASELSGPLVCQLADGRRLDASFEGRSREHDLALLKVAATGLPPAAWSEGPVPPVGRVVANIGVAPKPLAFGVVCSPVEAIPPQRGLLAIKVEPAAPGSNGVGIALVWPNRPRTKSVLRAGDLVTHIENTATPTTDEFEKARERYLSLPQMVVGDTLRLTVRRGGQTLKLDVPIEPEAADSYSSDDQRSSLRVSGFPEVFAHDGQVARNQCGGPLVDATGNVVALNIIRFYDDVRVYAIPSGVVRKIVEELRKQRARSQVWSGGPRQGD